MCHYTLLSLDDAIVVVGWFHKASESLDINSKLKLVIESCGD
jgi:hypothetical protein